MGRQKLNKTETDDNKEYRDSIAMEKYFYVNSEGCSISCKIYTDDSPDIKKVILFGHGFGGHKDNKAAEKLARHVLSKNKSTAIIVFNWPCHGDDVRKSLRLDDCGMYLERMIAYINERYSSPEIYGCATSFGGYLFLKYISENGSPFKKLALRCPAVGMYAVIAERVLTADDLNKIEKGKPVLAGFDRKIRIDKPFVDSLKEADITKCDFTDFLDDILIIHGTEDEIVPFEASMQFADDNLIEFIPAEGADHRFTDPIKMDQAIKQIAAFFGMK